MSLLKDGYAEVNLYNTPELTLKDYVGQDGTGSRYFGTDRISERK